MPEPDLPEARVVRLSDGIRAAGEEKPEPPKERPATSSWDDDGYDPTKWYDLSALGPIIMLVLFVILPLYCNARGASP